MAKNTIVYALSTLAQTCAALATFIGAVGLYRLQSLQQTRSALFHDTRAVFRHSPLTYDQIFARATEGHAASAAAVRSRQPVRCQEPPTVAYARAYTGSLS
jgi:hypothetical protein